MPDYKLRFKRFSETSVLVEWPQQINQNIVFDVLNFKNEIQKSKPKLILQIINSYNSLLIVYKLTIENINNEFRALKNLYSNLTKHEKLNSSNWILPICYDPKFGLDLEKISSSKNCSVEQIIEWHTEPNYLVYFIGFLPGFLYLGGLNEILEMPRLNTPRQRIKKGAVGIGGQQTGIYPNESPGGWNIIGNCPIELFNAKSNPPCFIKAGDTISFNSISKKEHSEILAQIKNETFDLQNLLKHD